MVINKNRSADTITGLARQSQAWKAADAAGLSRKLSRAVGQVDASPHGIDGIELLGSGNLG